MNLLESKYVIVEVIPTKIKDGIVVQLSALKLNGLELEDRFDYRVIDDQVPYPDLLKMISYDREKFNYEKSSKKIMKKFKQWVGKYPILYMDNLYTSNYLSEYKNKENIFNYLSEDFSDDVIGKLIKKHNLEPSNYIVDLLYESLIQELKSDLI